MQRRKNAQVFRLSAIIDLHFGMRKINLTAKVTEVRDPHSIITRSGNPCVLADSFVGDATETVKFFLWGAQIGSVFVVDTVQIVNS